MGYHKIIIVGETNVCRSFMAEAILRKLLQEKQIFDIEVVSRGLVVLFTEPVSKMASSLLESHGYTIEEFRSSPITREELEDSDLILTITADQAKRIKTDFETQTACMSIGAFVDMDEAIPGAREDVPEEFECCFHTLEPLMEAVADRVIGELMQ